MNRDPDLNHHPKERASKDSGSRTTLDHRYRVVSVECACEISLTRAMDGVREARHLANELGYGVLFDLSHAKLNLSLADAYFLPRDPKASPGTSENLAVVLPEGTHSEWGRFLSLTSANAGIRVRTFPDRGSAWAALARPKDGASEESPETGSLILVIEDNPDLLALTAKILRGAGYTVAEAASGHEGLEAAFRLQPDLILLDVVLPDMDGREACRILRASPDLNQTPVALVSGVRKSLEDQKESLDGRPDAYLTRPISSKDLLASLEFLLKNRGLKLEP